MAHGAYIIEPLTDDKYRAITGDQGGRMELQSRPVATKTGSPFDLEKSARGLGNLTSCYLDRVPASGLVNLPSCYWLWALSLL